MFQSDHSENALNCPISIIYTAEYFLEVILSICCFNLRDNFLSENIIFECKTCTQNGHHFERSAGHGYVTSDWKKDLVLSPLIYRQKIKLFLKTMRIEHENIPSRGHRF